MLPVRRRRLRASAASIMDRPRGARLSVRTVWASVLLAVRFAAGQAAPLVLDRATVARLARDHGPAVTVADTRVGEARALHAGAGALAPVNPELSVYGGPRWLPGETPAADVTLALSWPVDFSGARGPRVALADDRTRAAEADASEVRRVAAGEALDLWVRALGAEARVRLAADREQLDAATVTAARIRREAGSVGDGDVALAVVVHADGTARLRAAEGDREALEAVLRGRLGISPATVVALAGELTMDDPAPLAELTAALPRRADLVRAANLVRAARTDVTLQDRQGTPLPRLTLAGGRDVEYFTHVGVDLPLPVYQRNQGGRAIAAARVETATAERAAAITLADADLRAAHASWLGARRAFDALEGATGAMADAERLAARSYELGQSTFAELLVVRREAAAARAAHLDARIALARARIAVDLAAGSVP